MTHQHSWDVDSYGMLHKGHHWEPGKFKLECTGSGWDGDIYPKHHHNWKDIFRKIILNQQAVRITEVSLSSWEVLYRYIHALSPTLYLKYIRKEKGTASIKNSHPSVPLHWLMTPTKPKSLDHCERRSTAAISSPKLTPQFHLSAVFQSFLN